MNFTQIQLFVCDLDLDLDLVC